jgi:two-component system, chemotaxis family, protein-glutamate methylesterase/glutaminase
VLVDERKMNISLTQSVAVSARRDGRIRVMVVDDAVVVRAMITRWVEAELDMQVVGSLRTAPEAIEHVERKDPDVLILDVSMPEMDGITALPLLLQKKRSLTVLMVSTLTRRNAEISLQALSLGAADYIPKPEGERGFMSSAAFERELIEKIRVLGLRRRGGPAPNGKISRAEGIAAHGDIRLGGDERLDLPAPPIAPSPGIVLRPFPPVTPRVLLIGASTGRPPALDTILGAIGRVIDNAPVLITQHMPHTFTTILAEHLARTSGRPAAEARDGELVRAGHVYVAPGGLHMRVGRSDRGPVIVLDDGPVCKPSVDHLFTSAAAVWGTWNVGVILTGMGCDGLRGAAQLVGAGGSIIAQDEATSAVWGMPGRVAQAGLASAVLPLAQIAPKVARLFFGARP